MFQLTVSSVNRTWKISESRRWWNPFKTISLVCADTPQQKVYCLSKAEGMALGRPEVQSLLNKLMPRTHFALVAAETERPVEE